MPEANPVRNGCRSDILPVGPFRQTPHRRTALGFLLAMLLLGGCAGVGIMATSDPFQKIVDATYLVLESARPLPAERLIMEAMEIYRERQDFFGLALAHDTYGDLLLSRAVVVRWANFYRENGFQDKAVTYDNREAKAKEYYAKAWEFYQRGEPQLKEQKRYGALTGLSLNMADLLEYSKVPVDPGMTESAKREKICAFYDVALDAYAKNIAQNPGSKQFLPPGFDSVSDYIRALKKDTACR